MSTQFDKDLEKISYNYECAKDALNILLNKQVYTEREVEVAYRSGMNSISKLRDIACVGLKSKEQQSEN